MYNSKTNPLQTAASAIKLKMSFLLPKLSSKMEVDTVIKSTEDLVLVLRFGRDNDSACLQLDDIVSVELSSIISLCLTCF